VITLGQVLLKAPYPELLEQLNVLGVETGFLAEDYALCYENLRVVLRKAPNDPDWIRWTQQLALV